MFKKNFLAPVSTRPTLKAPQSESESMVKKKKGARTKYNSVSSNDEGDKNQHLIQNSCNLTLGSNITFSEIEKATIISKNNKVIKVTNTVNMKPEDQDLLEINPFTPANNLNNSNVSGAATTDADQNAVTTSTKTVESEGKELAATRQKGQIYIPNSVRHVQLCDANNTEMISKVSPRIVAQAIDSITQGKVESVSPLLNGKLLIKTKGFNQVQQLLKLNKLFPDCNIPIKADIA